ncbi:CKLF-like MARVEL transmembrane domain-containing protein 6 [Anoplopoma fimbria]|uniref:CKLF-like MARVEL transmembrane domain-containing protein 6 n=1 Tax=Anoplopoma fimbria TaxID=229290 RepID=UPI0023ECA262|nr:CKLF-like MARVEL transmembrane domain-containing protein 6 [Anoplopoma fimbria]
MADVYSPTTVSNPKTSWLMLPSKPLEKVRCGIKVIEVLLSFVAFIMEEMINSCSSCGPLYFFEFISCTAFLFTLLLLVLLYTCLHSRVGITCWAKLDFGYTAFIGVAFLLSSIIFTASNSDTTLERSAAAFGFLASLMFIVDFVLFVKSQGFPFKGDGKPESSNGAVPVGAGPEEAKLNPSANEAQ